MESVILHLGTWEGGASSPSFSLGSTTQSSCCPFTHPSTFCRSHPKSLEAYTFQYKQPESLTHTSVYACFPLERVQKEET